MLLRPVYPFESTKEIIHNIPADHCYFAALDMVQGYFQVPLDPETSDLTVFITPWGKYKYLRAPMGLAPSSDWFNSFTSVLVNGITGMNKSMDDFLGTAESLEKLEEVLEEFLRRCEELGVRMSIKKFKIARRIKFGGFIVANIDGKVHVEADPGKLERIRDFPTPQSKDDIASFIGLVKTLNNWSGAISPKMEHIRQLHAKGTHFEWEETHEREFQDVKNHLMETTRIATWDKDLPLRLYADAAKHGGFGFVLTQPEGDREHIIFAARQD